MLVSDFRPFAAEEDRPQTAPPQPRSRCSPSGGWLSSKPSVFRERPIEPDFDNFWFGGGGGLISYGVDLRWCYRRGAYFVDKILHGTPPGDLPVEFPTQMMLSINLKTAKALGITVPAKLLSLADEVIE